MRKSFDELKLSGRLPTPSPVGMAILRLTQREDGGVDEVARTIQSDPALTGRVLKVANSSGSAAATPVTTLQEAVLRLGFQTVRNIALGFSLIATQRAAICPAFDFASFWVTSLARAIVARHLCEVSGTGTPAEFFTCGLLSQVGMLALACVHPEAYTRVLGAAAAGDARGLIERENQEFGINHSELTEALLLDWGFPAKHAHALRIYEHAQTAEAGATASHLVQVLRGAETLAHSLLEHQENLAPLAPQLDTIGRAWGWEAAEAAPLLSAIEQSWREWIDLLNLTPAALAAARLSPGGPVKATAPTPAAPTPPAPLKPAGLKVLALEPDERVRETLGRLLDENGCEVAWAKTPADALRLLLDRFPQLILAREWSSQNHALDLCRKLRSFEAGATILFLLATPERDPRRLLGLFDAGIDDCLAFPYVAENLGTRLRAMRRILALRAALADQERRLQEQVAELAVLRRKLHRTASTDELTQLPNRRYGEERLSEEWQISRTKGSALSVMMLDLDRFKVVNDTHGHLVGDLVLAETGRVLRAGIRADDIACRLGGEEFLVILPNTELPEAQAIAERLRVALEAHEIVVTHTRLQVTASFGVASLAGSMDRVERLLQAADEAAYASKRAGRNCVTAAPSA